jgi:hypothetical protein
MVCREDIACIMMNPVEGDWERMKLTSSIGGPPKGLLVLASPILDLHFPSRSQSITAPG